jgi:transcriptional regulator with XRE-family HTH domain
MSGKQEHHTHQSRKAGAGQPKSRAVHSLGRAIRAARLREGYAQESFASKVKLDRSYYGAIERGESNITLNTLVKIAAGLGMTASDLLVRAKL